MKVSDCIGSLRLCLEQNTTRSDILIGTISYDNEELTRETSMELGQIPDLVDY